MDESAEQSLAPERKGRAEKSGGFTSSVVVPALSAR